MNGNPSLDGARDADPVRWFQAEFARAQTSEAFDPARAALATVDASGSPSVRFVLVKDVSPQGFTFYTNLRSPKAAHLTALPRAALAYHWHTLSLQVRVDGRVEPIDDAVADAYFASRPRESQLGAWASDQSAPIEDAATLHAKLAEVEERFADGAPVERPPHWSGLRIVPGVIEFWLSQDGRMHDRWRFERRDGDAWQRTRLQP